MEEKVAEAETHSVLISFKTYDSNILSSTYAVLRNGDLLTL